MQECFETTYKELKQPAQKYFLPIPLSRFETTYKELKL